jgi:hypothetical protein
VFDGRQREIAILGVRGRQAAFRVRTRSSDVGLRAPLVSTALGTSPAATEGTLVGLSTAHVWCVDGTALADATCWPRRPWWTLSLLLPNEFALPARPGWLVSVWWTLLLGPLVYVWLRALGTACRGNRHS